MDKIIQKFLDAEKNLTFCTSVDNTPHCVNCFYVSMHENNLLVFKSDRSTRHIERALMNDKVAGTIVPDIHKAGTIKGIQYTGKFIIPTNEILEKARKSYYLKFPFALVIPGELWAIELSSIKMIDNTLGFGKKINGEKPQLTGNLV